MSLTGHIADLESPVRAYLAARFPHTRELQFADTGEPPTIVHVGGRDLEFWTEDRFAPPPARVLPGDERGFPWALAGTAFDYRLRYQFEVTDPDRFVAAKGWDELRRLPRGQRASGKAWGGLVDALTKLTSRADPTAGALAEADELLLAQLCGVLGLYEQVYRMGGLLNPYTWDSPIYQAGLDASVDNLVALVDGRLPGDLAAMTTLFRSAVPELAHSANVALNPFFARSEDLRGADADLIVDRLLIELKTIKTPRLGRAFAWQVLGYLLADTEDLYGIESVGWYFARHGLLWRFPVDEFLHRLAGHDVDLTNARAEFADVCAVLRPRVTAAAPLHPVERRVRFYKPARGAGRWHTPRAEVPWMCDVYPDLDQSAPACGTAVTLDLTSSPFSPAIGVDRAATDAKLCRRCLLYTEGFFANRYERGALSGDRGAANGGTGGSPGSTS